MPRRAFVLVALLMTVTAACSSTSDKEHAGRRERGDVLPAPADEPTAQSTPTSTADVTANTTAPATNGSTPIPLPPASAALRGTIKLGVLTWKPNATSFLGVSFSFSDPVPVIRAAIAEVNEKGGIAGRRVEVAIAQTDPGDAADQSQLIRSHQQACVELTEDHGVFLVLSFDPNGWFARECYADHHTPYLDYTPLADTEDFRRLKPWLLPSPVPNLTKAARLLAIALRDQGFMSTRMGVFVYDIPGFRRSADQVLLPAIAAAGGEVVDVFYAPETTLQQFAVDVNAAVLRFRSRGVDRVVIWDGGITWSLFARRAQAEAWFPRYGIHSMLGPDASLPNVPPMQRPGTVAAGWLPAGDVADAELPVTARERECFDAINRRAGTSFSRRSVRENGNDQLAPLALVMCQFLEMTRAALAPATGKAIAQADVWDYFHALGSEPPVVMPPQTFFSPDDWDGSKHYAHLAYREDCDCFRYTSGWLTVPRG